MRKPVATIAHVCLSWLVLTATPALVLTGCKPSAEKIAAREEKINQEVESLCAKVQAFQAEGKFAEALALIDKNLNAARYAAHKERLFAQKLDLLLAQGSDAAACDLVIATWSSEPQLARSASGRLHSHYQQMNNSVAIQTWCKRLLGL